MVVDHTRSLEEGVADGAAHKGKAPAFQGLANVIGERGGGRDPAGVLPGVMHSPAAAERPDEGIETAVISLNGQEGPGIGPCGPDLQPVADDGWIEPGLLQFFI